MKKEKNNGTPIYRYHLKSLWGDQPRSGLASPPPLRGGRGGGDISLVLRLKGKGSEKQAFPSSITKEEKEKN